MSNQSFKVYGATSCGKMLISAEEVQVVINKELVIAADKIEQLQKENERLKRPIFVSDEVIEISVVYIDGLIQQYFKDRKAGTYSKKLKDHLNYTFKKLTKSERISNKEE